MGPCRQSLGLGPIGSFSLAVMEASHHTSISRERGRVAKFWLSPVEFAKAIRFAAHELREVERMVTANREEFLEAWHDFFGD